MPNIEMLQLLAEEFSISISEILAGEKFSDEESRHKADENAIATTSTSAFSLKERKTFFKKKWRREHFSLFAVLALILIAAVVFPLVFHKPWLLGIAPVSYTHLDVYKRQCPHRPHGGGRGHFPTGH